MLKSLKKNKKSNVTLYIMFIFTAIIIITIAALVAPMGVLFNAEMYKAGESIMLMANDSIQGIQNDTVRNAVNDLISQALESQQSNIEINSNIFKYSWIPILVISALIVALYSRQLVEVGGDFV